MWSLRQPGILAIALFLCACGGLPDWSDAPDASEYGALDGDWEFPDLSQLPAPPASPPDAAAHSAVVQELEAARLNNQRAGESVSSQFENSFEYPSASSN